MKYKDMIEEAKAKGLTNEKTMWESIDAIEEMLCVMKREHPDKYWRFVREQHGVLYNHHYSEDFAEHDVKHLMWKDREGKEHEGAHWTREQVKAVTTGKVFPVVTTECDKWVAYNVMYSDLCREMDEEHILKAAHAFFFTDDDFDYAKGSKVWKYMCAMKWC